MRASREGGCRAAGGARAAYGRASRPVLQPQVRRTLQNTHIAPFLGALLTRLLMGFVTAPGALRCLAGTSGACTRGTVAEAVCMGGSAQTTA